MAILAVLSVASCNDDADAVHNDASTDPFGASGVTAGAAWGSSESQMVSSTVATSSTSETFGDDDISSPDSSSLGDTRLQLDDDSSTIGGAGPGTADASLEGDTASAPDRTATSGDTLDTDGAAPAHVVPGRIEAEDFARYLEHGDVRNGDCGVGPVDQETTQDPEGGACNVAWTWEGEWLEYDLDVGETGSYDVSMRISSDLTGMRGHLEMDGVWVGAFDAPNQGWHSYQNRVVPHLALTAGPHVLRVVFDTGLINFNFMDVRASTRAVSGFDGPISNPTCVAPGEPSNGFAVQRLGSVGFQRPVGLVAAPDGARAWYVVEKLGRLSRFPNDVNATQDDVRVVLDITDRVNAVPYESGFFSAVFDPGFSENGTLWVSYMSGPESDLVSRVSRFVSDDGGLTFDAGSEEVVLEVPQLQPIHNGGHIAFGPDGYLYYSLGDDTNWAGNPQNTSTLYGSILRIDTRNGTPYGIPPDNPFAQDGGRPEIFAWGFRNPWKFSFDRQTGAMWAGDVGDTDWEEINIVEIGGNYGWSHREGRHCFSPATNCPTEGLIDPVFEYSHDVGGSVTGGYVYRGPAVPELVGAYIYGDFSSGTLWALSPGTDGGYENRELLQSGLHPSSFAEDADGEIYFTDHNFGGAGGIYRLVLEPSSETLPRWLSETGCVDPEDPTQVADGVIPYQVAQPFWSDDAFKERYIALPDGTSLTSNAEGEWELPVGGVTIKNFYVGARRVETRFFVRHASGSYTGYTYAWNDLGTDAELLDSAEHLAVDGQVWQYPSRSQCMQCHNEAAGRSLGLQTRQLNVDAFYPETGRTANQLATLATLGWLPMMVDPPAPFASVDDQTASLTDRARSYLHINCSYCHQPDGPGRGGFDTRHDTAFDEMNTCNRVPDLGDLGIPDARLIVPGDHASSLVWARPARRDDGQMPPLSTNLVDHAGMDLLAAWIDQLDACPQL